jgi:hypothetical protein
MEHYLMQYYIQAQFSSISNFNPEPSPKSLEALSLSHILLVYLASAPLMALACVTFIVEICQKLRENRN